MKKVTCCLAFGAACLLSAFDSHAQPSMGSAFGKGTNVINIGVGVGTTLYSSGSSGTFPPITASYERGIANGRFGIGGRITHTGAKWGGKQNYIRYSYTVVGVRGDYQFYTTDKLDTYGGLMLGYDLVTDQWHGDEDPGYKASGSSVAYSLFTGARYYLSPRIGRFGELGYGIAVLNPGLASKC